MSTCSGPGLWPCWQLSVIGPETPLWDTETEVGMGFYTSRGRAAEVSSLLWPRSFTFIWKQYSGCCHPPPLFPFYLITVLMDALFTAQRKHRMRQNSAGRAVYLCLFLFVSMCIRLRVHACIYRCVCVCEEEQVVQRAIKSRIGARNLWLSQTHHLCLTIYRAERGLYTAQAAVFMCKIHQRKVKQCQTDVCCACPIFRRSPVFSSENLLAAWRSSCWKKKKF